MQNINNIIPKAVLAILMAIFLVVIGLFFFGGDVNPNAEYIEPVYTGLLLNFIYILLGLTCVVTIISAIVTFITKLMGDPKSALVSFIGIGAIALLLILTYTMGDTNPMVIPSSEAIVTKSELQITNMCLNTAYILLVLAIVVTLLGSVVSAFTSMGKSK